jgi:hypothetical protein
MSALDAAAAELQGQLIRTTASVIGHRGPDSVIVATTAWGYTVTVMLSHMRIAFTVQPRGWLRKTLQVRGMPIELVDQVLDPEHQQRLIALQPLGVELAPAALRVEQRYGTAAEVAETIALAVSLARRARALDERAGDEPFLRTA